MAILKIPLPFTVDLNQGDPRRSLAAPLVAGDNMAHELTITVMRGKDPANLTGAVCHGYGVIKSNGMSVLMNGTVSGNVVKLTLAQACYAYAGQLELLVSLSQGSAVTTLLYLGCAVLPGATGVIIDPDHIIPSLDELLALIDEMNQAITQADAATLAANTAAGEAHAAADKWDALDVEVEYVPSDQPPAGRVTQTAHSTTFSFGFPQQPYLNATLEMDDIAMTVIQSPPVGVAQAMIDYAFDENTTMMYQRVHG